VRVGLAEETASEVAEAIRVSKQDLATKHDLLPIRDDLLAIKRDLHDLETGIAAVESRLLREMGAQTRTFVTAIIAMTGVCGFFVSVMAWVIRR
jgi:hypothetical protein